MCEEMIDDDFMVCEFTHANLLDLAGNAFSVPHCILAKLIAITLFRPPANAEVLREIRIEARAHFMRQKEAKFRLRHMRD